MVKKSTKKFQKNNLKRVIEQRKQVQNYKKKILKTKRAKVNHGDDELEKSASTAKLDAPLGDMVASELFNNNDAIDDSLFSKGVKSGKLLKSSDHRGKDSNTIDRAESEDGLGNGEEPGFMRYLGDDDKHFLESDDSADEDNDTDVELEDQEQDLHLLEGEERNKFQRTDGLHVTKHDLAKWRKALKDENSRKALKELSIAFKAAANVGKDESERVKLKYQITDPDVYNEIILLTLTEAPSVLNHYIPIITSSTGKETISTSNKSFQQLLPVLKTISSNLVKFLSEIIDTKMIDTILTASLKLLPYFTSFRKFVKEYIRTVVRIWGTSTEEHTRLTAWVVIRSIAEFGDKGMLELCIKTSYSVMVKSSGHTSVHTMPTINFLKNTSASLYSLDDDVAYQTAFDYIRQLAVHLRNSVVHKTNDSYKNVYNWQFIHSLDFWRRAISLHIQKSSASGSESALKPLVYPLVQLTLGTIRLIPAVQYFPLRFTLFRSLISLSNDADIYIPLLPIITEMLTSTAVTRFGKPSTLRQFDFEHNIRANSAYLGTRIYQNGVCEQIVDCILEFYGLYAKHISFPELAIPCIITLRRYARRKDQLSNTTKGKSNVKGSKFENTKFYRRLLEVAERLEINSKFIQEKRKNLDFGPDNYRMVAHFLTDHKWENTPLGQYLSIQREIREEKLRVLRESLKENNNDSASDKDDPDDVLDEEIGSDDN
ncbi:Noc2p family-domain-containing protein [Dipodascopsis uninucleata]